MLFDSVRDNSLLVGVFTDHSLYVCVHLSIYASVIKREHISKGAS